MHRSACSKRRATHHYSSDPILRMFSPYITRKGGRREESLLPLSKVMLYGYSTSIHRSRGGTPDHRGGRPGRPRRQRQFELPFKLSLSLGAYAPSNSLYTSCFVICDFTTTAMLHHLDDGNNNPPFRGLLPLSSWRSPLWTIGTEGYTPSLVLSPPSPVIATSPHRAGRPGAV